MNLNEYCLLKFLINPDEMKDISEFFIETIEEQDHTIILKTDFFL